ncbi:HPP family protein [Nitrosospira multiformis]|uniref:HPP family protein n=1 Tax=Nitrosospira multiformis TaxID=1231 RepID=UPI00210F3ECA|nr:HPP family protein [Nitrosospira multiformis]
MSGHKQCNVQLGSSIVVRTWRCSGWRSSLCPLLRRLPRRSCFAACLAVLASPGGSAVFLFGLTRAPAAQPRALFGGHPGGALIGIACYQLFGDSLWVYALAQVLALWYMLLTRTVHPPAGANPMIMIHAHSQSDCALGTGFHWSVPLDYPVSWLDQSPLSLF